MQTVSSSHGPTEIINARRTESIDAPEIYKLLSPVTKAQFGPVNIVHLIEKANLSVTLCNEENEILGFAGFFDHPQIDICDPSGWDAWMKQYDFEVSGQTPLNSLFMHYFTAKDDYTIGCATEIIRTVFNAVPDLRYIFLTLKNDVQPEPALSELFQPVEGNGPHTLYACPRHKHAPILHIRKAVVEDHDDLMPIFQRLNNSLTETYGDYFLAEMIEAQDENNHSLVAEVNGKAIGYMSICADVNIQLLQDCFELAPFHGLCKPSDDDILYEEKIASPSPPPPEVEPTPEEPTPSPEEQTPAAETEEAEGESVEQVQDETEQAEAPEEEGGEVDQEEVVAEEGAEAEGDVFSAASVEPEEEEEEEVAETVVEERVEVLLNPPDFGAEPATSAFKPLYAGESNAFSVQLFCIDEQYEMRSSDFLPEAFKLFPDKSIAVITVPHLVPEFPLIQQFVRATPQPPANVSQELYIFHRDGLLTSQFKVRKACTSDLDQIMCVAGDLASKDELLSDLQLFFEARRDPDGIEIQAFVADCLNQVVGVAVLRREENIEHVRSHYNIEDFIYFNHHRRDEHGHLHHFALNPAFNYFTKHFMKEILRQGNKSCIYYPILPADAELARKHSLVTGLSSLVPVRARRQIIYPLEQLGINAPSTRVRADIPPYALYHLNRKLTLEPKVTVNARIVVVGASDVGISFLESICFCPHLKFNNLTLISKRGLPDEIVSTAGTYSTDNLARMSLPTWVNVVKGVMVGIDRARKQVLMQDGSRVSYNHLLLTTGQQYQIPALTGADVENGATNHDLSPTVVNQVHSNAEIIPDNVLAINDHGDVETLKAWSSQFAADVATAPTDSSIVIYGRTFEAYRAIQMILSCGVPGGNIVLALPPNVPTSVSASTSTSDEDPMNEPAVSSAVLASISSLGVKVLPDHCIAQWDTAPSVGGVRVTSVSFTTPTKPLKHLPCHGVISLHPKRIDFATFRACNNACLVFDGRLTINARFQTNDPLIRAAGPLTKYARRYHTDTPESRHENQSSKEIGFRLAMTFLPIFDPTLDGGSDTSAAPATPATPALLTPPENPQEKLVPVYSEAKVLQGVLPGGMHYLHVRKPGEVVPYAAELAKLEHGHEVVTGSAEEGNYFRLHINQYSTVETITCLSSSPIPSSNIIRLYGLHERYLNNLLQRVSENLIPDLYKFFMEPWCLALYHDRFLDFRQEIRDLLSAGSEDPASGPSIETLVRQLINEDIQIDKDQRQDLFTNYTNTKQKKTIEERLLSFLSYNYYHLPMYAKPGMVS